MIDDSARAAVGAVSKGAVAVSKSKEKAPSRKRTNSDDETETDTGKKRKTVSRHIACDEDEDEDEDPGPAKPKPVRAVTNGSAQQVRMLASWSPSASHVFTQPACLHLHRGLPVLPMSSRICFSQASTNPFRRR